jgi:CSLREA domain-containing protein
MGLLQAPKSAVRLVCEVPTATRAQRPRVSRRPKPDGRGHAAAEGRLCDDARPVAIRQNGYRILVTVALATFTALVFAGAAAALTVDTTADGSGGCSLRAAIEAVNTNNGGGPCGALGSGTTTIELPAGHYVLSGGELSVAAKANLAIVGADPEAPSTTVIDGNKQSRVFEVASTAHATLDGVEVTGGATLHGTDASTPHGFGGVGESGGGVLVHGSLTLEHVLVTANMTGRGGNGGNGAVADTSVRNGGFANGGGSGGGIYNESGASLVVHNSTISANQTGDGGAGGIGAIGAGGLGHIANGGDGGMGGQAGGGGGIYNAGTATIVATTVSKNGTGRGGAGGAGGEGAEGKEGFRAGEGGWGARGGNSGLQYGEESGLPTYTEEEGGGGIDNRGTLTMSASTIAQDHTGAGGNGGGAGLGGEREAPLKGRETSGKAGAGGSAGLGGGLLSVETGASSLTDVTVSSNLTGDGGTGGAGAQSNSRGGGPGGFGGFGGGIWARGNGAGLQLAFVTIAANAVGALGAGGTDPEFDGISGERGKGAGIATGPSSGSGGGVTVSNSILSGNGLPVSGDTNCSEFNSGALHDGGHDVSHPDSSCPGVTGDPLLGALAANGGPTETMLPGAGSSAIGLVPLGSCSVAEDQRGLLRPGSGKSACDAGAVETGGSSGGATATSTALSSSANPSVAGTSVTFTATVSPSPGGGTVVFRDDGVIISGCTSKPVVAGQASCAETSSSAGSHSIVAEFGGTAGFKSSISPTLTQVVEAASEVTGGGGGTGTGGGSTLGGSTPPPGGGFGGAPGTASGVSGPGAVSAGAIKSHRAMVSVALTCAGPSGVVCVLKLLLSAPQGGAKGSAARRAAHARAPKKVVIGVASVAIDGGAKKVVSVSLNAAGKRMLAKAHSLKATLTVTESGRSSPILTRGIKFTATAPAKARGATAMLTTPGLESPAF